MGQPLARYGLDSIVALELVADLEDWLGGSLPHTLAWDCPTITAMAQCVAASATPRSTAPPGRAYTAQPLGLGQSAADTVHPLSYGQQALWFLHQQAPDSTAYNLVRAARVRTALDVPALRDALQQLVDRHPALRTTFPTTAGKPVQLVHAQMPVSFRKEDASAWSLAFLQYRLSEEASRPFALEHGPLLRVHLYTRSTHEQILLLAVHHIVVDFWSLVVLLQELGRLYQARICGSKAALPPLTQQYTDYVRWQADLLNSPAGERSWAYWREQLAGDLPVLHLPTDQPQPPVPTSPGASQSLRLGLPLTQQLKVLSQTQNATLYTTLLAAFYVLLHRYTGQEDLLVGSPMAGRSRAEWTRLVGYIANPVALRANLAGDPTFIALLAQVRQTVLGAFEHQDYPLALLVERLRVKRAPGQSPLFRVMFLLQKAQGLDTQDLTPLALGERGLQIEAGGLCLESMALEPPEVPFDLTLTTAEVEGELIASLQYNTALFEAPTIRRLLGHFQTLLAGIVTHPYQPISALPLLTTAERQQMLVTWNSTQADYPRQQCVHQLFEAQVARTPDAVAVVCDTVQMTYRELNQRANQLAHHLRRLGVRPDVLVGLCVERSPDMVVGLLGILKAGGAYVPLDPDYPRARLAFMLEDAQVSVLLTQARLVSVLPKHAAPVVCLDTERHTMAQTGLENPVCEVTPEHLAYVLYTSGSTGTPKGVLGLHRGAVNRLAWMWQTYPFAPDEVGCQKTSLNFVDAVWELFGPLLQGIPTVLIPEAVLKDPQRLVHTLAAHRVSRMVLVPSLLRALLDLPGDLQRQLPTVQLWISSGEPLPVDLCRRFQECLPHRMLLNLYGSSEVAADVTWYDTRWLGATATSVPIGRPLANTQIYLLDAHQHPVPIGVPGELYAGGDGLARGYLHRSAMTAERFIPNPFSSEPGARLYKTGDLARYLPDGTIEFLGRRDHQVKLRGRRLELGEIEAVLGQHPAVREAVVVIREDTPGARRLVAYVVPTQPPAPTPSALRSFLQEKLPEYMIPAAFEVLYALPLAPNGKVDRLALPAPDLAPLRLAHPAAAPHTPVQTVLTEIWNQLLGRASIGIHDNFFELGGHSLLAVQLMHRIRQTFDQDLPLTTLIQAPTIADLATSLEASPALAPSPIVPLQANGTQPPLFCLHAAGGQVMVYQCLATCLGPDQPLYGVQSRALADPAAEYDTLDAMAADYAAAIRQQHPETPYSLLGWSMGGMLALAVAGRLEQQGHAVACVGLIDTYLPTNHTRAWVHDPLVGPALACGGMLAGALAALDPGQQQALRHELAALSPTARLPWLLAWGRAHHLLTADLPLETLQRQVSLAETHLAQCAAHRVAPIQAPLYVWWARDRLQGGPAQTDWSPYTLGAVHTAMVNGNHFSLLQPPQVRSLAKQLRAWLHTAQPATTLATSASP